MAQRYIYTIDTAGTIMFSSLDQVAKELKIDTSGDKRGDDWFWKHPEVREQKNNIVAAGRNIVVTREGVQITRVKLNR